MHKIQIELRKYASDKVAKKNQYFFKTGKGEYGYGDIFIGVLSADLRKLANANTTLAVREIKSLIRSKIHEERALGLLILVYKFKKSKSEEEKEKVFKLYITMFKHINNWDLVDCSSPYIVGAYLLNRDRKILYTWAMSDHLWTKRIAMLANWWFIRKGDLAEVFKMAKILLNDEHDLMHKAVGWMLREAGKKDLKKLEDFLKKHYQDMPRTMLRYSIEKFPEQKRQRYLKGKI
jgi:3-methyladenine DNA glycosylase AlkD